MSLEWSDESNGVHYEVHRTNDDEEPFTLRIEDCATPVEGEDPGYCVVVFSACFTTLEQARLAAGLWKCAR